MNLLEIQDSFSEALNLEGDSAEFSLLSEIGHTAELPAIDRIGIYRASVHQGHANALTDIFKVCEKIVGERFFRAMAQAYFNEFKSKSPDAGDFGRYLPEFVKHYEHAKPLRYLTDVARLELAWYDCFCGSEYKPLNFTELELVPPEKVEKLRFSLPANAHLIKSQFPIIKIWEAAQENYQGDESINLDEGGDLVLVWRKGIEIYIERLSKDEYEFCYACDQGYTLAGIQEKFPNLAIDKLLPVLTQRGWLSDFTLHR
jgi:Putative DNA-binding domain